MAILSGSLNPVNPSPVGSLTSCSSVASRPACRHRDLRQLVEPLLLFLDQELGVTNYVDGEDMPDLKVKIIVGFRRHHLCVAERRQAAYLC